MMGRSGGRDCPARVKMPPSMVQDSRSLRMASCSRDGGDRLEAGNAASSLERMRRVSQ